MSYRPAVDVLEPRRLFSTYTVDAAGGADYTDLNTAITDAAAGSTLLVHPGTYTAHPTTAYPTASVFWVNKPLTIKSTAGAGSTTLVAPSGQSQVLLISSSNVAVQGFTLNGGYYTAQVQDFQNNTTLTNVSLRGLTVHPDTSQPGHGILFQSVVNSLIDGCTVGLSYANGIMLDAGSNNDRVSNNTVLGTVQQMAIAVKNSNDNQVVDNTVTGAAHAAIFLLGADGNRVAGNQLSGFGVDGIVLTNGSDDNDVQLNTVVSDGRAAGRTDGVGIWVNSESDRNTLFANTVSGSVECGIDVFVSSDTVVRGNEVYGNGQGGIFVFDALNYPASTGLAPAHTVIDNNYVHDNPANAGVVLRGATDTIVSGNALTGAYAGTYNSSTDAGLTVERSADTTFADNTVINVETGVYAYATATNLSVYRNRFLGLGENYAFPGSTAAFDASVTLGGNFWSNGTAGQPYSRFISDGSGRLNGGTDRFPFAAETLSQAYGATVTAPAAGTMAAAGSHRSIEWTTTGAARVSLYLNSSATGDVLIAAHRPDNGVYNWTVPTNLPAGTDYAIKVVPEDSAGTPKTQVLGPQFTIGSAALTLLSPGRDDNLRGGGTVSVSWTAATAGTAVDVQLQTTAGGAWTTLASGITADATTVTLPHVDTAAARLRVVSASATDTQDSTFRISDTTSVAALPAAVQIGTDVPLTWSSPAAARTVDLTFYDGTTWQPIATGLPDRGRFTWAVPERYTVGAQVRVAYRDANGASLATATSAAFNVQYGLSAGAATTVYRLYNRATQEHLYTTDANEYAVLGTRSWDQEGAAYKVYNGSATVGGLVTVPEYRLYNPATFQHLWTTDRNEYFTLRLSTGWVPEGVAAYVAPSAVTSSTPLYRLSLNGPTLLHLWTTDRHEYDVLGSSGWTQEGAIGQVLTA